jgi:hypothetical protein
LLQLKQAEAEMSKEEKPEIESLFGGVHQYIFKTKGITNKESS